jgi:DnaJ-domain-containing protein 1
MSISRRLIDLARSELNSLLDSAARKSNDGDGDGEGSGRFSGLSDADLQEELERRRKAREEVDELLRRRPGSVSGRRAAAERGEANRPPSPKPLSDDALKLKRAYAALEVREGSDFETVRRAYRDLMRKYHPDRHAGSPEKQRAANEVAQRLTEAYKLLEKQLRR